MDAEKSILGALMLDNACFHDLGLCAEDFSVYPHAELFRIISTLLNADTPADPVTVIEEANRRGVTKKIGGSAYLADLAVYTPTASNARHYAGILKKQASIRRTGMLGRELLAMAEEGQTADFATIEKRLLDFSEGHSTTLAEMARRAVVLYEERWRGERLPGLSYGYNWLDRNTGGMTPGQLIIIAARPSMGKTALALNIAKRSKAKVLLFSLETSKSAITDRLFAAEAQVPLSRIKNGRFYDGDFPKLAQSAANMQEILITIDDQAALPIGELSLRARREKIRNGLGLIIVDYLQLITCRAESRLQEISSISRALKGLAKSLNVPVIALSQLNRSVDGRENKRPTMSDLRESGQLEQDADVILFPYRDSAYCEACRSKKCDKPGHDQEADITIAKNKDGVANIREPFLWFGETQRFEEMAHV